MQDLAISGTSDFKMFPVRTPQIIVLEDVITSGPSQILPWAAKFPLATLGTVQRVFWNIKYSLFCGYTLLY
jgi:hypothetical protein